MAALVFLLVTAALRIQLVSAHFQINYPSWRDDSFNAPFSQYTYPCAGVDESDSAINRTAWPLTGGSLNIDFHHPFTYVFLNLGVGTNVTNFNISLNAMPINETGNGTFCIEKFVIPSGLGLTDGTNASLQISTVGPTGAALYNCADIVFRSNATLLPASQCSNDTGVSWSVVNQEFNGSTPITMTTNSANASATAKSGASASAAMNKFAASAAVVVLGVVFSVAL
ncbi:hypothetical protein G7Y89_g8560 [Cudoniella acicularis]|uniref:Copper acquisition factor BIM1-like domain-containing protein n=1 Tax=Cudoniella acicularis TaxID=354080 RepID=A0A8H4RIX5_9HELO|nr:hypothetical protein G7Y89_g8560 [Cudoniella acicularis]